MMAMVQFRPVTAESWAALADLLPLLLGFNGIVCIAAMVLAYANRQPAAFMKEWDGRLPLRAWMIFWPYLAYNHLVFTLWRLLTREPAFNEIAPGLLLGRRLSLGEQHRIRAHEPLAVLDLTAEFGEPKFMREQEFYRQLPTLDMTPPSAASLEQAVEFIRHHLVRHTVYVHCALGRGRSAAVILAWLLAERKFATFEEAYAWLRRQRPGVRLTARQQAAVRASLGRV